MNSWKKVLFFLLLNVLVSAGTTLAVLIAWDRTHPPLPGGLLGSFSSDTPLNTANAPAAVEDGPAATPTPAFLIYQVQPGDTFESLAQKYHLSVQELLSANGFTQSQTLGQEVLRIPLHPEAAVVIDSVAAPGDLNTERVLIKQTGEGEISLAGWQLDDGQGHTFTFPAGLTLFKDGAINVYTRAGNNTVIDLFWGLAQPIWQSGKTVALHDAAGKVKLEYKIP